MPKLPAALVRVEAATLAAVGIGEEDEEMGAVVTEAPDATGAPDVTGATDATGAPDATGAVEGGDEGRILIPLGAFVATATGCSTAIAFGSSTMTLDGAGAMAFGSSTTTLVGTVGATAFGNSAEILVGIPVNEGKRGAMMGACAAGILTGVAVVATKVGEPVIPVTGALVIVAPTGGCVIVVIGAVIVGDCEGAEANIMGALVMIVGETVVMTGTLIRGATVGEFVRGATVGEFVTGVKTGAFAVGEGAGGFVKESATQQMSAKLD